MNIIKPYIQIVSHPNLRIIDYGYGFMGSTHDSTAWEETHIFLEHTEIFDKGEFIWGDSAYLVRTFYFIVSSDHLNQMLLD